MDSVLAVGPAAAMDDPNPASDASVSKDPAESSDDAMGPESNKLATTPPRRKLKSLSAVLASPSDTSSISSECSSSYASTAAMTTATADVTAETIVTAAGEADVSADVAAESIVPAEGESSTNSASERETPPTEAPGGESSVNCEAHSEAVSPLRSPPSLATVDRYPSERNVCSDHGEGKDDEDDDKDESEEKNEKDDDNDDDDRVEEEEFASAIYDLNVTADHSEVNEGDQDENDDESGDDIQGRKGKDVFKGIAEGVALNIVVTKDELERPDATTADSCCQVDEEVDEYDGAKSNDNDDGNLEMDDAGEGALRDGDGDVDGGGFLVPGARDLLTPHHPAVVEAATSSVWSGVLDSISLVGSGSAIDANDCCDDVKDCHDAAHDDNVVEQDNDGAESDDSDSDSDSSSSDDEEDEEEDDVVGWEMAAADSILDDDIADLKTDLAKAAMRLVTPPEEEPVGGDVNGDNHRLLRSDSYRDSHSTDGNGGSSGNCKSSSLIVGSLSLSATEEGERGDMADLLAAADEEAELRAAISVGGEPIDDTLGLVLSGGSHVGNCLDAPNGAIVSLRHMNSDPPTPTLRGRNRTAPDPLPPSPLPSSPGSAMSPFDLASSGSPPTPDLRRMCFRRTSAPDPPLSRPSLPRIPRSVSTSIPRSVPTSIPRSVSTTTHIRKSDGYDGVFRRRLPIVEWYDRNRLVADAIEGALKVFPTDCDAPPPEALRELALLGGSGTRSLCSSLDSGDNGGGDVTESLKVLPLSDASYRVRFENKRIMLRLMCEIFDKYNSNAVPVGPFFELSIRRRSVRRAGSRTRSRGSGLSTATGTTSVASSRQQHPHRRRQRAASPPLENVAEERQKEAVVAATAKAAATTKGKEGDDINDRGDGRSAGTRKAVSSWTPVYRSYPLPRTSRPAWEALDVGDLGRGGNNNEEDVPVRIDVYDAAPRPSQRRGADRRGGGGRLIGSFVASSRDLLAASTSTTEGPAANAGTAKSAKHRGGGRGGRLRLRPPRKDASAKAEDSNHGTEPIDEDCCEVDCNSNYKRDHRSRHSGSGQPNEGVLFPLTRNGKKKGWVRVRAERADDDGTRNGGGDGGGVRLQLEMRLPRVRIGGKNVSDATGPQKFDGGNEGGAQMETTAACHPHNKGGRGLVHIRRRRPSPYFEISLPKEEGATHCHDGKEERREVLGDVHWDWCTIYRSYPVLSKGRCPSWEALEVILPPDAGRTGDAPVRVAVYDSAKGGGSHVERCLASKAAAEAAAAAEGEGGGGGAASPAGSTSNSTSPTSSSASSRVPGFVGAFEARVWDLTQGEERRFALIGDGRQKGWIRVLATERCDL